MMTLRRFQKINGTTRWVAIGVALVIVMVTVGSPRSYGGEDVKNRTQSFIGGRLWPAVTLCHTRVVLASEITEKVAALDVEEGEGVKKGEQIMRLDSDVIDSRVAVARVKADFSARIHRQKQRFEHLKREYKRSKSLVADEVMVTRSELDNDRTKMEVARQELEELKRQAREADQELKLLNARRKDYTIRSPIQGVVSHLWVHEGELAKERQKIAEIVDPAVIETRTHLPERFVNDVDVGDSVVLEFTALTSNVETSGEVFYVSPSVDNTSGMFEVKILTHKFPDTIKPGMACRVGFPARKPRAVSATESQ